MNYHAVLDLTPEEIKSLKMAAIDLGITVKELVGRLVRLYLTKKIDPGLIEEDE